MAVSPLGQPVDKSEFPFVATLTYVQPSRRPQANRLTIKRDGSLKSLRISQRFLSSEALDNMKFVSDYSKIS